MTLRLLGGGEMGSAMIAYKLEAVGICSLLFAKYLGSARTCDPATFKQTDIGTLNIHHF
jgi:hypothetical protein